jgi:hypothetical protein
MNRPQFVAMAFSVAISLVLFGCNSGHTKNFSDPAELERYATLPLASGTHHPELRAALAEVVAQGGTPAQLAANANRPDKNSAPKPPNAIVLELVEIFPTGTRERFLTRLATIYPDAQFRFAPLVRGAVGELLQLSDDRRRSYQRLISTELLEPAFSHAQGMGADSNYLQAVEVGNQLLALSIAESLDADHLLQAVEALDAMFRATEWLAREKHPMPRLAAVGRRAEALAALGAIARHPRISPEMHAKLIELVDRQLSRWPADSDAWIGERAEGLHTYELVRDGYLLSILPFEDLRKFREEIGVEKLGQVVAANLDFDELYFLKTMRKVIAGCSQPFHQREALFQQIEEELEKLRSSDRYPFVADQLLLDEIANRQRLVALDRSRCEAWRIALANASGSNAALGEVISPVTGQPFSVVRDNEKVTVSGIGGDEPEIDLPLGVRR